MQICEIQLKVTIYLMNKDSTCKKCKQKEKVDLEDRCNVRDLLLRILSKLSNFEVNSSVPSRAGF